MSKQIKNENKKNKRKIDSRNKTLKRTAILSVIVLIAIVIVGNALLNAVVGNKLQFDWTPNKAQTLSDVSKNILGDLENPVHITVLSTRENYPGQRTSGDLSFVPRLLEEYEQYSNDNITVQYVDPVQNPAIIDTLDPNGTSNLTRNQIVVSNHDHSKLKALNTQDLVALESSQQQLYLTGYTAEESITNAVRLVSSEVTPVAYLTSGHGELALEQNFTMLKFLLEQNRYYIDELDTRTATNIPEDTELLLMLAPSNDIAENEVQMYLDYLEKGNSLIVIANYSTSELPNLNRVLREYNLFLTNNRVRETNTDRIFPGYDNAFLAEIPSGSDFANQAGSALAIEAAQIRTADNSQEWIETQTILQTSDQGVLDMAGDSNQTTENTAVHSIAMLAKNSGYMDGSTITEPAQVAVFGSAWLFNDSNMMNYPGNYLIANSAITMLSGEVQDGGDLLIQPTPVVSYYLPARSQSLYQVLGFVFLGLVPIALLVVALITYRRRKKL